MALYERNYTLSINATVIIEAASDKEAEAIFERLETGDDAWDYFKNEVFDQMGEILANNECEMVNEVYPNLGVEEATWADEEDALDYGRYLEE